MAGEAKSEVRPCSSSQRLSITGMIKNSVGAACRTVDSRHSLRLKVVFVVQLNRTEHFPLDGFPCEGAAVLYGNTDPREKERPRVQPSEFAIWLLSCQRDIL